ncbi:prepilin peptidase [Labedella populi]|uniref:Prepilin peptidase n=1 Tax=Labedella populi TaxID=2498850 RepID=A0A3S3ZTZ4_9MICO|nr:A24 family peptidase [Labedella populi]RWZ64663.1 prepilin peptidase [Labedella populi]
MSSPPVPPSSPRLLPTGSAATRVIGGDGADSEPRGWRAWVNWRRDPEDTIVGTLLALLAAVALGPVPALVPTLGIAVVTPVLWRADIIHRRLPNILVAPCALLALCVVALAVADGGEGLVAVLVTSVLAGVFFALLSAGGGMGMGDVKLAVVLATVLALVRVDAAALAAIVAFGSGGVGGLVVLLRTRARSIPFGPFLLVGFWVAVVLAA